MYNAAMSCRVVGRLILPSRRQAVLMPTTTFSTQALRRRAPLWHSNSAAARSIQLCFTPTVRWSSSVALPATAAPEASAAIDDVAALAATNARNQRVVGYWLLATAGAVFIMIVLGGVTRLTRSGLSIVEWRPEGETLPTTDEEWAVAFSKYQQFPEYKKVNGSMTLEEFKPIYWMEWGHRQWGRAIGVMFAAPLAYLLASRRLPPGSGPRLGMLLLLGGTQGGVGWWMVKSGLEEERFKDEWTVPRVSPYRLATHLGFAFSLYSMLLWFALDAFRSGASPAPPAVSSAVRSALLSVRPVVLGATALIATTVASGAFVAGNDAGHAYNDWPLFAGKLVPEQIWDRTLGARNLFENTATVQFDHRMLAYSSLIGVGAVHAALAKARRAAGGAPLPRPLVVASRMLGGLVLLQVTLGVSTLVMYVPVPLAALHQAGAVALLSGAIRTLHALQSALVAAPASAAAASEVAVSVGAPRLPRGAAAVAAAATTASSAFAITLAAARERDE